jgi:phosphate starvation-inducible PhoH-like protein
MSEEVSLQNEDELLAVCGSLDENIDLIEDEFPVTVIPRGDKLIIEGEQTREVARLIEDFLDIVRRGKNGADMEDFLRAWQEDAEESTDMASDTIIVSRNGTPIGPRTVQQKKYVEAIRNNDIVFGIGPAGTGKTYLSMAMALSFLESGKVSRIVLARPAVEAGENLGFLPGDLQEKVNPYLRPLYDAIYDMMDIETCDKMLEEGTIEVAPLACMRGRTLSDSFVILDEAQNTTAPQMKMFLTRFGVNSRAVINGDITQIDLPGGESGLVEATKILSDVEGLEFVKFSEDDVVRHSIVQRIIEAYEEDS